MKKYIIQAYLTNLLAIILLSLGGCNDPVFDFGYDGELSGKVTDNSGNAVSGDIKLATYSVHALGEYDLVPMVVRIKSDGTYSNSRLYPQSYKVILRGPFIESPTDTVVIDLTGGKKVEHNFTVTPLLTIPPPTISGSPSSTEVVVNYAITGNGGRTPNLREIYVSTVSWPTRTTGSGMGYITITTSVGSDQGTATITGLQSGTNYYVRVGARASGQNLFNHSEQISFTTP